MSTGAVSKRIQKLKAKIEQNPKHVRFEDLDKLLRGYGFAVRQPRRGSSHYVYKRGQWLLTVPYRRPHIREHYVKETLAYIEEIETLENKGPVLSPVEGSKDIVEGTTQQTNEGTGRDRDKEEGESGTDPDSLVKDG
jgi:hypothetical protein